MTRKISPLAAGLAVVILTAGCASKTYVRTQTSESEQRLGERLQGAESMIEESQELILDHERRLEEQESSLTEASQTARDALERAIAAGKLAEGKLLYERTLSDDQVRFASGRAELGDAAKEALDAFAAELKGRNAGVFIEIQGHTDSTGGEDLNLRLGEERAEAVRRYLSRAHGFPLHRTSVISYGESQPAADNSTAEGRARNRRVTLVVLE